MSVDSKSSPARRRAGPDLLVLLALILASALPLALVIAWAWDYLVPIPGSPTLAGCAAGVLMGLGRLLVCYAGATAFNVVGAVLGVIGAVAHPERRGRALCGLAVGLNATPHLVGVGLILSAILFRA